MGHGVANDPTLASDVRLDCGEGWLNRIEVGGVRREEFDSHSPALVRDQCEVGIECEGTYFLSIISTMRGDL